MFKIVTGEQRTFKAKCQFKMPNEKGTHDQVSFTGHFVMLTSDESKNANDLTALEFARKVLIGFDDVMDGDGNPVPFNEDTKEALLQIPIVAINVTRTYNDAINKGLPSTKN